MVTCYRCMERLPDQCKCPNTKYREKIANWLKLVKREVKLITEIHENNYNPTIECRLYSGKRMVEKITKSYQPVEINDYNYEVIVKIFPKESINKLLTVLYDAGNKPLFRHRYDIPVVPPDGIKICWCIGIGHIERDADWSWIHYP
jgi:hypothetical protein